MIVKCIKNSLPQVSFEDGPYDWQLRLTVGKEYRVIGIECNDYRIVNEADDPCLYPPEAFEILDPSPGDDWGSKVIDDGALYWGPLEFRKRGFWEAYHDGNKDVIKQVRTYLMRFQ